MSTEQPEHLEHAQGEVLEEEKIKRTRITQLQNLSHFNLKRDEPQFSRMYLISDIFCLLNA